MKISFLFAVLVFSLSVEAQSTIKLWATTGTDNDNPAYFLVKTAVDDRITYCAESLYIKGEDPKKKGRIRFLRQTKRAYGEFGIGGRLLKYKRWLPGGGGSIMYMVFRYGSRIRRRVEEVIGGSAQVSTLTRGRTIHVFDPQGPGWMVVLLRFKGLKSFKCVNPVTGKVGKETVTKGIETVILPKRGEIEVKVLNFTGDCGNAKAFLNKRGHLIGGKIGQYTLEIPLSRRH